MTAEPTVYRPQPVQVAPAPTAQAAPVLLPQQPMTVAYVPGPDGRMIAAYVPVGTVMAQPAPAAVPVQQPAPAPLAEQPRRVGVDPIAQRLAGVGVAAAGVGWGLGEVVSAMAGATSSVALVAAAVVVWKVMPSGARTVVHNRTTHHHTTTATGMFGRASSKVAHTQTGGAR